MPWWPLGTGRPRPGRAWGPAVGGATHSPAGLMGVSGLGPALSSVWAATGDVVTGRSPDAQRAALASGLQVLGLSRRPAWWRRPEVTGRRRAALSGGGEARGGSTRRAQGLRFCRGEGSLASLSQEQTRGFHSPPQGPAAFCPASAQPPPGVRRQQGKGRSGRGGRCAWGSSGRAPHGPGQCLPRFRALRADRSALASGSGEGTAGFPQGGQDSGGGDCVPEPEPPGHTQPSLGCGSFSLG